jgi:hypothetical protein
MIIATAIVCLGVGAAFGCFITDKASQRDIFCAWVNGHFKGRCEQDLEVRMLRRRITQLEAEKRTIFPARSSY